MMGATLMRPGPLKNNIIYNLGSGDYKIPGIGAVIEGNLYYENHPENEPFDPYKLIIDPLFINPGNGGTGLGTLDGYKLQESSPIINSGVNVPRNGGLDFG